jgi:hypothetical protein
MIEVAIADWRAGVRFPEWSKRGRRSAEAAGWLFDDERGATLTFADVCDLLGAEPGWMRAMILSEYATDGVSNGDGD